MKCVKILGDGRVRTPMDMKHKAKKIAKGSGSVGPLLFAVWRGKRIGIAVSMFQRLIRG